MNSLILTGAGARDCKPGFALLVLVATVFTVIAFIVDNYCPTYVLWILVSTYIVGTIVVVGLLFWCFWPTDEFTEVEETLTLTDPQSV